MFGAGTRRKGRRFVVTVMISRDSLKLAISKCVWYRIRDLIESRNFFDLGHGGLKD